MAEKNAKQLEVNKFKAVIIFLILGIMPLIVFYASIPAGPEQLKIMPGQPENVDMFSYYKSWIFVICTVLLGFNSLWDFFANNIKFDFKRSLKNPIIILYAVSLAVVLIVGIIKNVSGNGIIPSNQVGWLIWFVLAYGSIFLPLVFYVAFPGKFETTVIRPVAIAGFVFVLCVFYTTAFTEYRFMTFNGAVERFESVFVLLGYIIIFLEVLDFSVRTRESKFVMFSFVFSALLITLIGVFQLFGLDFFDSDFAQKLTLGAKYAEGIRLTPRFENQAYSTLYNPNCVGMYTSMIAPWLLVAGALWNKKSITKYILLVTGVLALVCLVSSNSTAGLVGFVAALLVLFALLAINLIIIKNGMKVLMVVVAGLVVSGPIFAFVPAVNTKLTAIASKLFALQADQDNEGYLRDIKIDDNKVTFYKGTEQIGIEYERETSRILIKDSDGNLVEPTELNKSEENSQSTQAIYNIDYWGEFQIVGSNNVITYKDSGMGMFLGLTNEGKFVPLSQSGGQLDLNQVIPSIGFENHQNFGSARGYIWSKTFPLLKDTLLIGHGADTFIMTFPQQDFVGKLRFFNSPYIYVDKPHNMYLQTAVNTGMISLLAQLAIFAIFLLTGMRKIITYRNISNMNYIVLLASVVGIVGYLVSGLATDSLVSVAPLFWGLLGLGFASSYALGMESKTVTEIQNR